jgi:hypothetical protein
LWADTSTTGVAVVPLGGTSGQVLAKSSGTDYDTAWATPVPFASPTFTGVPAAPTATAGTNTTQLATTEYVQTSLGTWTAYTPVITQSGTITNTIVHARYQRIKNTVFVTVRVDITGTGTSNTSVSMSLPVAAKNTIGNAGGGAVYDANVGLLYNAFCFTNTSTTVLFAGDWANTGTWGTSPNLALGSGDAIWANLIYEAA